MSEPEERPQPAPAEDVEVPTVPGPREYAHRRAPKYGSFIFSGVVLGVLVAAVLYLRLDHGEREQLHFDGVVGYVGFTLVILGAVLGAAVALLIERGQNRRSGRR